LSPDRPAAAKLDLASAAPVGAAAGGPVGSHDRPVRKDYRRARQPAGDQGRKHRTRSEGALGVRRSRLRSSPITARPPASPVACGPDGHGRAPAPAPGLRDGCRTWVLRSLVTLEPETN